MVFKKRYLICHSLYFRAAQDPVRRTVQGVKAGFFFFLKMFSPSYIKSQIAVAQQMTVAELIIGFF